MLIKSIEIIIENDDDEIELEYYSKGDSYSLYGNKKFCANNLNKEDVKTLESNISNILHEAIIECAKIIAEHEIES